VKENTLVEMIARLSNPGVNTELGLVLQMVTAGELF
jgi:hypothetical protein